MVATQESINSRFCSVVEIKLSFSSRVATYRGHMAYSLVKLTISTMQTLVSRSIFPPLRTQKSFHFRNE